MITPTDPAIRYSPYNWDLTAARAKTINAGAYFQVLITGSPASIALTFDLTGVAAPVPRIRYDIDGTAATVDLAASITIPLPASNTWGKHVLTVTVEATSETADRWNTQATAVAFTGITTTGTAAALPPRTLTALALGDSITEGVRTLNKTAVADTERNSAVAAWPAHLGRILDAEIGVVGFGGTGVSRGGSGNVPAISGFLNRQWSAGPTRGLESRSPDYVIVNIGTNDPTATDITVGYTALLDEIHALSPNSLILCLLPFNGSHAAHIQAAIAAAADPARCVYVNTAGWWSSADASDALHPYGYTSPAIARNTAAAVRTAAGTAPAPIPNENVVGYVFDTKLAAVPALSVK